MIRVEITKTVWRTKSGAHAIGEPVFPGGEEEWQKESQTLLVQEFEDLHIEPIVALLNRLQETPLCTCGDLATMHAGGLGKCSAVRKDGPTYMSDRSCDCQRYESRGKAEFRKFREEAEKENATLQGRLSEVIQQRERLHSDIARLTRSRDSLLTRRKGRKARA